MMIHGSSVSRPRGMTGVGSLRNHHRQILQLWTDLHCSRLCLGGTPCPWWGWEASWDCTGSKFVGVGNGPRIQLLSKSCRCFMSFEGRIRIISSEFRHGSTDIGRGSWRKKQHQTTKGQLLQILQPGCFKTKGWNQLRLPGYRCKMFRILNTFLDLPTLPQQVVAKLKQATLEMLGEGADAAQKMTRMINPEVGASWTGMILIKNSAQVDSLTIFKPFSNHLKSPSIPAFPWPAF